jgi:hypothetical protein
MNDRDSGQKKLRSLLCCAGMKKALKHKCFKAFDGGDRGAGDQEPK